MKDCIKRNAVGMYWIKVMGVDRYVLTKNTQKCRILFFVNQTLLFIDYQTIKQSLMRKGEFGNLQEDVSDIKLNQDCALPVPLQYVLPFVNTFNIMCNLDRENIKVTENAFLSTVWENTDEFSLYI